MSMVSRVPIALQLTVLSTLRLTCSSFTLGLFFLSRKLNTCSTIIFTSVWFVPYGVTRVKERKCNSFNEKPAKFMVAYEIKSANERLLKMLSVLSRTSIISL